MNKLQGNKLIETKLIFDSTQWVLEGNMKPQRSKQN